MSGLRNIYQHHSNYKGLRVKIPCGGHTYMLGGNGAGKTTTLNLIPVFYGKDPASLIARSASKVSFIDHYLPNHQSLVVFEYERMSGEVCCVAMYRREAGQYAYRFIKGAADDTLFTEHLEPLYERSTPASEILKYELPKLGVEVSNQILNTIDYRSIIQGDPMSGGKRRHRRSAAFTKQSEMRNYSLGNAGDKMQHIESLTAIAFNSNKMLANLKTMIVDTMIHDYAAVSQPQTHHKSEQLWSDISGLQAFANDSAKLRKGLHANADLKELRARIVVHRSLIKGLIAKAEQTIREDEDSLDEIKKTITSLTDSNHEELTRLSNQIAKHRGERAQLEEWLDALGKTHEEWEICRVDDKKKLASERPSLEIKRRDAIDKLKALTAQASSIDRHFDQMAEDAKNAAQHEKTRLWGEKDKISAHLIEMGQQHAEQQKQFFQQCQDSLDALNQEAQEAVAQHQRGIDNLHQDLDKASHPHPDEEESLAMSQQVVDATEEEKAHQEKAYGKAQASVDEGSQRHDEAVQTARDADNKYAQIERDACQLADRLNPGDNTLLAFLRESGVPWHDTIGKAISPSLLLRSDLSPALADPAGAGQAFGVALDLTPLSRPEIAEDEAVLQARLDQTESDLRRAKMYSEQCQETAKKKRQALRELKDAAALAQRKVVQVDDNLKNVVASHRDSVATIEKAKAERRETVQVKIRTAKDQMRQRQQADASAVTELRQSHERQALQHTADYQAEDQRLSEQQSHTTDNLAHCDTALKEKLRKQDTLRIEALSDEGVDTKSIQDIKSDQASVEKSLAQIELDAPVIREYDGWREQFWTQKNSKEKEFSEAEQELQRVTREKADTETTFTNKIGDLRHKRTTKEQSVDSRKRRIQLWGSLASQAKERLDDIPISGNDGLPAASDAPTARGNDDQIETQLRSLVFSAKSKIEEVIFTVRRCHGLLSKHPNSMVYRAWEQMSNHRRNTSTHIEGSPAHNIEMMHDIERLLDHEVPTIESALIENVHATGAELNDYYEALGSLSRAVDRASRRLHSHLNTENTFDSITDLSVTIRSKIHDLGFWKELSAFNESWTVWISSGANELPDETLLQRIRLLQNGMNHARMDATDIHSMVEMEIEFYEQKRRVPVRTDNDLENASSKGISRLAILVLFSSLTRYLCPNEDINLTWPIDELGELELDNINRLFDMMQKRNISLFCAEPKHSPQIQHLFDHRIAVSNEAGVRTMVPGEQSVANNPLLAAMAMGGADKMAPAEQLADVVLDTGADQ